MRVLKLVHCESSFFWPNHCESGKDTFFNSVLIYFLVERIGGEISTDNFDSEEKKYASAAEWIELGRIGSIKFINSIDSLKVMDLAEKLIELKHLSPENVEIKAK